MRTTRPRRRPRARWRLAADVRRPIGAGARSATATPTMPLQHEGRAISAARDAMGLRRELFRKPTELAVVRPAGAGVSRCDADFSAGELRRRPAGRLRISPCFDCSSPAAPSTRNTTRSRAAVFQRHARAGDAAARAQRPGWSVETLMLIDSLEMTDADRAVIAARCRGARSRARDHARHRHDGETARALARAVRGKTIVLTGAMVPYTFGSSDGLFNLGSAISFAQALPGRLRGDERHAFRLERRPEGPQTGTFERLR